MEGSRKSINSQAQIPSVENTPHSVNVSFVQVFRVMQFLGFVAVFVTGLVHILVLTNVREPDSVADVAGVLSVVLFFISAVILLAAICEAKFLRIHFGFLLNWVGLGLSLFYLAIVTLSILASNSVSLEDPWPLVLEVVCWTLAAIGVMLFLLGMCGCKKVKDKDEALMTGRDPKQVEMA